jgi:hypothetical protein
MPRVAHECLCDHIIHYMQNECKDGADLTATAKEARICFTSNLLNQEEYNRIVEAGKQRRKQLDEVPVEAKA